MNGELYAIVSMAARYWFCALMLVIVARAWRVTVIDNRRARRLREWSGETGCIGEFVINPGKTKKQQTVPIPREGILGSARGADVRVKNAALRRFHASFEQREGGLLVRPFRRAQLLLNGQLQGKSLFVRDGDTLSAGKLKLLLVLFDPEDIQPDEPDPFLDEDALWKDYENAATPGAREPSMKETRKDDLRAFEDEIWEDK